MVYMSSYFNT